MSDKYEPYLADTSGDPTHGDMQQARMREADDGGYVLASDYDLLVTEHEKTESELATVTGAYLGMERERDAQQQLNRNWLKENAPGGWIDNQRKRIGALEAALVCAEGRHGEHFCVNCSTHVRATSETKDECAARVLGDPKFAKEYVEKGAKNER